MPSASLLERDAELGRLQDLVDKVEQGDGGIALINGSAGIGKTTLLRESMNAAAKAGLTVLAGRGVELEHDLAFGVARRLFERRLAALDADERRTVLDGAAALSAPVVGEPTAALPVSDDASFAVLHGLYWLAGNLAALSPLVIGVDDAHWIDEPTLRWLAYLAERIDETPILLLIAGRDGEPTTTSVLRSLAERRETVSLTPQPLSEAAVAVLVQAALTHPSPDVVAACHRATGGNPYLVGELLHALTDEATRPGDDAAAAIDTLSTQAIARSVLPRLTRLGEDAVIVAKATAVLGNEALLPAVAAVSGLSFDAATHAVDRLANAEIVTGGSRLEFVHPLIRTTVYTDLSAGERMRLHASAAEELHRLGCRSDAVAAQLLHAPATGWPPAISVLREAAAGAFRLGDAGGATQLLRRALDEPPSGVTRAELLLELGRAEAHAGDPSAIEHLEQALAIDTRLEGIVAAALALGDVLVRSGHLERAGAAVTAAADRVRRQSPTQAARLDVQALLLARSDLISDPAARDRWLQRFKTPPSPGSEEARTLDALRSFAVAAAGAPAGKVQRLANRSLGEGELLTMVGSTSTTFHVAVQALCLAEQYEQAEAWWNRSIAAAQSIGSIAGYGMACCYRSSFIYLRIGRLLAAEEDAQRAFEIAQTHGQRLWLGEAAACYAEALLYRGSIDAAATIIESVPIPDPLPAGMLFEPLLRVRGLCASARGEMTEALDDLFAYGDRMRAWNSPSGGCFEWRCSAAELLAAQGEHREATALVEAELTAIASAGTPRALGVALRTRALVNPAGVDLAGLEVAIHRLEATPADRELARTLIEYGAALRRNGHRRDASGPLEQGYDIAQRIGAGLLAERGRQELHACGARPRRTAVSGVEALTPSERRVAELAAGGLSNIQIAQALFVTRKTIEKHLGNAYPKLGIAGRDGLAAALRESKR